MPRWGKHKQHRKMERERVWNVQKISTKIWYYREFILWCNESKLHQNPDNERKERWKYQKKYFHMKLEDTPWKKIIIHLTKILAKITWMKDNRLNLFMAEMCSCKVAIRDSLHCVAHYSPSYSLKKPLKVIFQRFLWNFHFIASAPHDPWCTSTSSVGNHPYVRVIYKIPMIRHARRSILHRCTQRPHCRQSPCEHIPDL